MRAAKLVDLAAHELFPSAPVLGDQTGVDQDLDVLLHCGEADRIQPAELADGALTVESPRDDVAPSCITEREKQPVGLLLAFADLQPFGCRLHLRLTKSIGQRKQDSSRRLSMEAWRSSA